MLTPFSGLSLIIHLLIIGVAKVIKTIIIKSGIILRAPVRVVTLWDKHSRVISPSLSILIVVLVALGVSTGTTIAVKTGLREGAQESHSEFIQKRFADVQIAGRGFAEWNMSVFGDQRPQSASVVAMNDSQSSETGNSFYPNVLKEFSLKIVPAGAFNSSDSKEN